MDPEIKFISINRQSVEFTKKIIKEIAIENNLILNIQNEPSFNEFNNVSYDFSIFENKEYESLKLFAKIHCSSFLETWFFNSNENPKKHLGTDCYYIMNYLYVGEGSMGFMFDFAILFLEKLPSVIVETLEPDKITLFKEYSLDGLKDLKRQILPQFA